MEGDQLEDVTENEIETKGIEEDVILLEQETELEVETEEDDQQFQEDKMNERMNCKSL